MCYVVVCGAVVCVGACVVCVLRGWIGDCVVVVVVLVVVVVDIVFVVIVPVGCGCCCWFSGGCGVSCLLWLL